MTYGSVDDYKKFLLKYEDGCNAYYFIGVMESVLTSDYYKKTEQLKHAQNLMQAFNEIRNEKKKEIMDNAKRRFSKES